MHYLCGNKNDMQDQYAGNLGRRAYSGHPDYDRLVDGANRMIDCYNASVAGMPVALRMGYQLETIEKVGNLLSGKSTSRTSTSA